MPDTLKIFLLIVLAGALSVPAAGYAQDFAIQNGAPFIKDRIVNLNTVLDLKLTSRAEEALQKGIPLEIVAEVRVIQQRWWWTNKVISDWDVRRRLLFHALSRQFIVSRVYPPAESRSFATLDQALIYMGHLDDVQVYLTARKQFYPDARYFVEMRARLNIEALPALMRPLAYVTPSWRLSTGWHRWPVQP